MNTFGSPGDAQQVLAQIAQLLGVDDPSDFDAIDQALEQLIFAIAGDQAQQDTARMSLSESERKAVQALGCDSRDFLRLRGKLKNWSTVRAAFRKR
jgi:hypothetical protein